MNHLKTYKIFEDTQKDRIKIKFYNNSIDIDHYYNFIYFYIMLGREEIGQFQLEIKFEKNENDVYKIENGNFNVTIQGFEIEDDFRGRGLGKSSFKKITEYIHKNYKNNKGIYLSVLSNNDSAIKIYKETGFKVIEDDGEVLKMKYED